MARPRIRTKEYWIEYRKNFYQKNKEAVNARNKKWEQDNPEKLKAYQKLYRKQNKEKARIYHKEYRENNRKKLIELARNWVSKNRKKVRDYKKMSYSKHKTRYRKKALARQIAKRHFGGVNKGCEFCGGSNDIHKHHPDYDNPKKVIFLCRTHHGNLHRLARGKINKVDSIIKVKEIFKNHGILS